MNTSRYGIDWRQTDHADYPDLADEAAALVLRNARTAPDEAELFIAAHCLVVLQLSAAGRDGLALLRAWLTPGFEGRSVVQLIRATLAWSTERTWQRAAAVARIDELHLRVRKEGDSHAIAEADRLVLGTVGARQPPDACLADLDAPSGAALYDACEQFRRSYARRCSGACLGSLAEVALLRCKTAEPVQ